MEIISKKRHKYWVERNFGLVVGCVFGIIGAWWLYREKFFYLAVCFSVIGTLLVLSGAVYPRLLVFPNRLWMKLAEVLSFISTYLILSIVFFLIVLPIGFIKRLFGWDPLRRRARPAESYWQPYPARQRNRKHYEKMY